MKKSTALFAFLFVIKSLTATAQNFLSPMNEIEFRQRFNQLQSQPGGDEAKLRTFRQFIFGKSLTSRQVKQFATTLASDFVRYQLALDAYNNTFDKQNFYDVYDAFATMSAAFRLHDAVNVPAPPPVVVQPDNPPPPVVICEVRDNEFEEIKTTIKKQSYSSTMKSVSKQILSSKKCFTSNQLKQIVPLFSFESDKLEIIKFAYDYTTDQQNFYTLVDVLKISSSKEDLMNFINTKR